MNGEWIKLRYFNTDFKGDGTDYTEPENLRLCAVKSLNVTIAETRAGGDASRLRVISAIASLNLC